MYGRNTLFTVGSTIQLLAMPNQGERHKPLGLTLDWSTVAPVAGADVSLKDGVTIKVGDSYLRYGQVICRITASGKYGPYDPAAVDGRQTLARGQCWLVNRTVVSNDPKSDYPEVIDGGVVWFDRLIQSGTGAHSLAAGPTLAELVAAFPTLTWAQN